VYTAYTPYTKYLVKYYDKQLEFFFFYSLSHLQSSNESLFRDFKLATYEGRPNIEVWTQYKILCFIIHHTNCNLIAF